MSNGNKEIREANNTFPQKMFNFETCTLFWGINQRVENFRSKLCSVTATYNVYITFKIFDCEQKLS